MFKSYYDETDPSFGEEFTVTRAGILKAYNGHAPVVVVPDGIHQLADYVFKGNETLERVELPALAHINTGAFEGCKNLKEVVFRGGIWAVGTSAFEGCVSLEEVVFPEGTVHIANRVFYGCTKLRRVAFPRTVQSFHDSIFSECPCIECIEVDKENPDFYVEGNCIVRRNRMSLVCGCDKSVIPEGVRIIERRAFFCCAGLKKVVLPATLLCFARDSFFGCADTEFRVDKRNPRFYDEGNCIITRKSHILVVGSNTSVIPQGVKEIGLNAFQGCDKLERVTIPEGVERIGQYAFDMCTSLKEIEMPRSVACIEPFAFGFYSSYYGDESATAFFRDPANWENGCLYVGNHLIAAKTDKVAYIKLHEGATVGMHVFMGIDEGLQTIDLSGAVAIADKAFENCYGLKKIILPRRLEVRLGKIFNSVYQRAEIELVD